MIHSKPLLIAIAAGIVLVAWALAAASAVTDVLSIMTIAPLAIVLVLGVGVWAILAFLVGAWRVSTEGIAAFRLALTLVLALTVAIVGAQPVAQRAQDLRREAQHDQREAVARELIARAEQGDSPIGREVDLAPEQRWLSDSGQVLVFRDKSGASVLFWDFRGILDSYSAGLYAETPGPTASPGGDFVDTLEFVGGHWWTAHGD